MATGPMFFGIGLTYLVLFGTSILVPLVFSSFDSFRLTTLDFSNHHKTCISRKTTTPYKYGQREDVTILRRCISWFVCKHFSDRRMLKFPVLLVSCSLQSMHRIRNEPRSTQEQSM